MTDRTPENAVLAMLDLCGELGGRQSGESHAVFLRRLIDALIAAQAKLSLPTAAPWKCKAQPTADPPQDCDWPVCGCDPYADKVIAALEESGYLVRQP
jgi:hypothetical protein